MELLRLASSSSSPPRGRRNTSSRRNISNLARKVSKYVNEHLGAVNICQDPDSKELEEHLEKDMAIISKIKEKQGVPKSNFVKPTLRRNAEAATKLYGGIERQEHGYSVVDRKTRERSNSTTSESSTDSVFTKTALDDHNGGGDGDGGRIRLRSRAECLGYSSFYENITRPHMMQMREFMDQNLKKEASDKDLKTIFYSESGCEQGGERNDFGCEDLRHDQGDDNCACRGGGSLEDEKPGAYYRQRE